MFAIVVKLICDIKQDLIEDIFQRVSDNLICTEIDDLVIDLNNNKVKCQVDINNVDIIEKL